MLCNCILLYKFQNFSLVSVLECNEKTSLNKSFPVLEMGNKTHSDADK